MTEKSELVPVDPNPTRAKIVDFIHRAQAKALEFPDGSVDRAFLQGQAVGAFAALQGMTLDLAAACDAADGTTKTLN